MGTFTLLEALPEGPQARVFRARQNDDGNIYALKVFHQRVVKPAEPAPAKPAPPSIEIPPPKPASTEFEQYLAALVADLSGLDGPHLPKLLTRTAWDRRDVMGEHSFNAPENAHLSCLGMEYFAGGSLHSLLATSSGAYEPIDLALAVDIIRQAALGVAQAHAANRLHCNLKPTNLLLTADTNNSARLGYRVVVSDFSIIPPLQWKADYLRWASTETWIYSLPPEYYALNQPALDARADVYALGVLLYTAISGRPPFDLPPRRTADWEPFDPNFYQAMLLKYSDAKPLPALTFQPHVTEKLQTIIQTCLEKDPGKRYTSAGELAGVLEKELQNLRRTPPQRLVREIAGVFLATPQVCVFYNRGIFSNEHLAGDGLGESYSEYPLNGDGLVIGSAQKSDIILSGIAAQQLRIDWNAAVVSITNLAATNGEQSDTPTVVRIAGAPLAPGAEHVWGWEQSMEVGPYLLRLVKPTYLSEVQPELPRTSAPTRQKAERPPDWITIETPAEPLQITPGREASFQLKITFGETYARVEALDIRVQESSLQAWFLDLPVERRFSEADAKGDKRTITLQNHIFVPIAPESRAIKHVATIRATSKDGEFKEAAITLDVQRFVESSLTLRPSRRAGALSARYTIYLRNKGNATEHYQLTCEDEARLLVCDLHTPEVEIEPGQIRQVGLIVHPHEWIWLGQPERHDVVVAAASTAKAEPQRATASFEQRPLIPRWAAILLVLALVAPCLIIYLFRIPTSEPVDQALTAQPLYGILKPTMTFTPTPTTTATPTSTVTPTVTSTPTVTPTPTADATLIALLVATAMPTPVITPTATLSPTNTIAPATPTLVVINGVALCPARGTPYTVGGASAIAGQAIGLWIEWIDGNSAARKVDGGEDGKPFTVHADGAYGITLIFTAADGPGLYLASIREIGDQGAAGRVLTTFSCRLLEPDETPTIVPATPLPAIVPTPTSTT